MTNRRVRASTGLSASNPSHPGPGCHPPADLRRFRPILLTTLTPFGGLTPIILETSIQAQYLIPMAISLGFGVVFATSIMLVVVPCLYMALEDAHGMLHRP